mmetsp:Transcript_38400/g.120909  ORF Transcript_38400/g.120909 Transcript_38400/m.120909 type:complete len:194 (-) Transcript_38400:357-938(-)
MGRGNMSVLAVDVLIDPRLRTKDLETVSKSASWARRSNVGTRYFSKSLCLTPKRSRVGKQSSNKSPADVTEAAKFFDTSRGSTREAKSRRSTSRLDDEPRPGSTWTVRNSISKIGDLPEKRTSSSPIRVKTAITSRRPVKDDLKNPSISISLLSQRFSAYDERKRAQWYALNHLMRMQENALCKQFSQDRMTK